MGEKAAKKEVDWFRDTPLRLLGYANEVGEAFRSQVHVKWVWASYGVASAYVLADTAHKTNLANENIPTSDPRKTTKVINTAVDTLVWQAFASVMVPGYTINRLCKFTQFILDRRLASKAVKVAPASYKWIPTAVGLVAIPFIVLPIDHGVHWVMDKTVRVWIGTEDEVHPKRSH